MVKKLEIFKPGTHTAMNGTTRNFTEADLAATVAAYDPGKKEAPLVVGHPKIDAPAYGWVRALSFADKIMQAEPTQVDAAFAEMVNTGRFKKVSASFYLPDAPGNPVPGVYYLRHVGFLGAQAPAIKGLKSASFADAEEGVIEFGDWSDQVEAGLFRKLREWIIGKFGVEEADKALPGWDVDLVQTEAAKPEQNNEAGVAPAYAEGQHHNKEDRNMPTQDELAAKEAELKQQEASFAERETKLRAGEKKALHQEHLAFAEGLVKEGKLLPAMKETAVALIDFAAGLDAVQQVVEFGEGEGKKSVPAAELFKEFLTSQPKVVEFSEIAKAEKEAVTAEFAAAPGFTVDADSLALHNKAIAYQGAHPGVDYLAAVRAVS